MAERWIDVAMARLTPGQEFYPGAKLAELADKYSVSRERIRQVEVNVLRRLSWGIKQKSSLTAAVLDLVKDEVPDEQADAPLAWFATELGSQGCSSNFTQFMLEAFLLRNGTPRKIARQLSKEAMAPIRKIGRAKISARGRSTEQDEISEGVLKANAFVLEILKKAVWPQHLNKQPVDLTGFQPLRACRYDRPYYSKTLQRLVGFDSMGERRLIKALDSCTIVTEFVEQPVDIRYHYDGADRIYIPDLLVRTDTDLFFIIEVKGRTRLTDRETLAKAAAAQSHLGARSIGYCLVDENGFGLDDLRALTPDDEFMQQLGSLLEQKGEVQRWMFERAFERERLAWAYDQLQSAVLREGLLYETWLIERRDMPNRYIFDFRLRLS
ncbi:hypothetical protein GCM10011491_45740 [Brucella endophytica]|uniref:RNA polymerase sigma-70 region 4 domain-containing protein n=2 Tax=Brucella endophytica TaxID=1963359 RepID=A0A916WLC5_9HYPH|nr:hypothetical protein GCM10011491_45740 [Brucella endophytica]